MVYALYFLLSLFSASALTCMSYKMFQIYQLSSYRGKGFFNWVKLTRGDFLVRYFAVAFFSFVSMLVYVACFKTFLYVKYLGLALYFLFMVLFIVFTMRQKSKTPLIFTARVGRFVAIAFVLFFAASCGALLLGLKTVLSRTVSYSILGLLPMFIPLIVTLAHFIVLPFEKLNNLGYRNRAVKKLATMPSLVRIGITGSYGKTTAKNILAKMLEEKYKVCYSPSSYNTPMGISKVINNQLEADDEIFIAEMGARNVGDIAELAKIVNPNYGIITAIGNQHLETFGSRQAIINTKYELVENLAVGGFAAFNGDNADAKAMYDMAMTVKVLTGADGVGDEATYSNIIMGDVGASFTLKIGENSADIKTKLLGKHIPSIVALCAVVAANLGVSMQQISDAMGKLEPIEHRLSLKTNGDISIIDDAYNSNTEGAKNALDILAMFDGVKIVITPGLVELGVEEKQANMEFGRQIAVAADYAYLVGANAQDIRNGAIEGGMSEDKIFVVKELFEAVDAQKAISGKKVLLFENDLPDNL